MPFDAQFTASALPVPVAEGAHVCAGPRASTSNQITMRHGNTHFFMFLLHAWTIDRYTRSPVVDSPSASVVGVVYAVYDCVHFCIIIQVLHGNWFVRFYQFTARIK